MSIRTYDLNEAELAATIARAAKINARAAKRGWTGRIEVTSEKVTRTWESASGIPVTAVLHRTTIGGQAPSYQGWTFLAALDWEPDGTLITRTAPGTDEIIDRSALAPGACDHCRSARYRKSCYLVRNDATGETKQVGSTCIKDFLGWSGKAVFISTDGIAEEDGGEFGWGAGGMPEYTVETVLAAAWAIIQLQGSYVPSSAPGTPTRHLVEMALCPGGSQGSKRQKFSAKTAKTAAASPAQAVIIRDYLLSDKFPAVSEYAVNLRTLLAAETVTPRSFGYLCSAPQAWARATDRDLRRAAERDEITNEHFGTVKERVELTVRIKTIRYAEHEFGVTTIYKLLTSTGHLVTWFSSRATLGHEADGTTWKIKATVKGHDEYEGMKSTVITRAAVVEKIPAAEPQAALSPARPANANRRDQLTEAARCRSRSPSSSR
jgi:hypothetical protein